jgi:hypothetical protein
VKGPNGDHIGEFVKKVVRFMDAPAGAQHAGVKFYKHLLEEPKEDQEKRAKEKEEKGKKRIRRQGY